MIAVPTSTVMPSSTNNSVTVPAKGDGSSTRDLAVSISQRTSLIATVSPGLTFQATTSASVRPSPTSGRLNFFTVTVVLDFPVTRPRSRAGSDGLVGQGAV